MKKSICREFFKKIFNKIFQKEEIEKDDKFTYIYRN